MKYYSSWQDALIDFIKEYGHNYEVSYALMEEFEQKLNRNSKNVYFMYTTGEKNV